MTGRHIRLDRRQFYLFEGLGINSQFADETAGYADAVIALKPLISPNITAQAEGPFAGHS